MDREILFFAMTIAASVVGCLLLLPPSRRYWHQIALGGGGAAFLIVGAVLILNFKWSEIGVKLLGQELNMEAMQRTISNQETEIAALKEQSEDKTVQIARYQGKLEEALSEKDITVVSWLSDPGLADGVYSAMVDADPDFAKYADSKGTAAKSAFTDAFLTAVASEKVNSKDQLVMEQWFKELGTAPIGGYWATIDQIGPEGELVLQIPINPDT